MADEAREQPEVQRQEEVRDSHLGPMIRTVTDKPSHRRDSPCRSAPLGWLAGETIAVEVEVRSIGGVTDRDAVTPVGVRFIAVLVRRIRQCHWLRIDVDAEISDVTASAARSMTTLAADLLVDASISARITCRSASTPKGTPKNLVASGGLVMVERVDIFEMAGKTFDVEITGVFVVRDDGGITRWRDYYDMRSLEERVAAALTVQSSPLNRSRSAPLVRGQPKAPSCREELFPRRPSPTRSARSRHLGRRGAHLALCDSGSPRGSTTAHPQPVFRRRRSGGSAADGAIGRAAIREPHRHLVCQPLADGHRGTRSACHQPKGFRRNVVQISAAIPRLPACAPTSDKSSCQRIRLASPLGRNRTRSALQTHP